MKHVALKKAESELQNECKRQVNIIYGSAAIALKTKWKYGTQKIVQVFDSTDAVWEEVGDLSMLQMLEDETGIEIQITGSSKSWHDLMHLNGKIREVDRITFAQELLIVKQQTKWMTAMVQACIYLALYRNYGWGVQKITHLKEEIDKIREELGDKEGRYVDKCWEITGIHLVERYGGKSRRC